VKETVLAVIFVIHAMVFAYFYLRRGRQAFHLMFCGGFVLLAVHYAYNSWQFFVGVESGATGVPCFRWAGLMLCALATPFFLFRLCGKKRSKFLGSGHPPEP
jgi:hypothetical protein